jgi:Protein of unknown function (DUF2800)
MHLSLLRSDDERLGLPSGSTFDRLIKCPPSHALSQRARELGQVAHETSPESERGTLIHNAYELQSANGLSVSDAADYEAIMAQREEITAGWLPNGQPVQRIAEERLWLHRGLRPVLSGQIDELLIQGARGLLFDVKSGRGQVDEPQSNVQLRIYAILVKLRWPQLESVTVAVLSPHYRYTPHTFNGAELEAIRDETLETLAALDYQAAPSPGAHCCFCPASMICPARRQETAALAVRVQELPAGADAARLLETVARVEAVCEEIRTHYKAQLEVDPLSIPGWRLQSSVRRWIPQPQQALERLIEQFSVSEFLDSCSVKVADLEVAWARKNSVPVAQTRRQFNRFMDGIIAEKRTAPSLKPTAAVRQVAVI